jgi:hypothetical protein
LKELHGFVADLKADRAAQKEKEPREAWTKYTSLSIVVIAVLAAVEDLAVRLAGGTCDGRSAAEEICAAQELVAGDIPA